MMTSKRQGIGCSEEGWERLGEHLVQSSRMGIVGTHPGSFRKVTNKGVAGYGTWNGR
jgi:hypothetical protein